MKNEDIKHLKLRLSLFWKDALHCWCQYKYEKPADGLDLLNQPIWCNSHIRVDNKVIMWKNMLNHEIHFVKDLVNRNCTPVRFFTLYELQCKYTCNINAMLHLSIKSSLQCYKHDIIDKHSKSSHHFKANKLCKLVKCSKYVHNLILKKIYETPTKILFKWCNNLNVQEDYVYQAFSQIYTVTIDVKLRVFQYKLLHRCIALNRCIAFRLKICETDKCSFCDMEKETIHHLSYYCVHTRNLWFDLRQWLTKMKIYIPDLEEKKCFNGHAH